MDGMPPMQPNRPHNRLPESLTPQKRKSSEFGHCMDRDTITWSAANRKFSRVERSRTTHEGGVQTNLFKVPLHETTTAERERRENAERQAENLQNRLRATESNEIFVELAKLGLENKTQQATIEDLKSTNEDLKSKFETLMSKFDDQQTTIENQQTTIEDLKSTVANQQATIANQQATIEDLKSTVANQQATIEDLKSTVADQQNEMGILRGLSPLCG